MESLSEQFAGHGNTIFALVFLLAVVLIFLRWSQRSLKASAARIKKFERPTEPRRPSHNQAAPGELARAEIQFHEMVRDLNGQLDTKIALVHRLLRTAEEHIARLERAVAQAEAIKPPAREPGAAPRGPNPSDGSFQPLAETAARPAATTARAPNANALSDGKQDRYRAIYELADAGYTSRDIAPRVGTPVGEIELILSLRGS